MRLKSTESFKQLKKKLYSANLAKNNASIDASLELLCNHIENIAPAFRRKPEDMLGDLSVNLISDLKDIAATNQQNRFFQLVGRHSNLISQRQYSLASMLHNQGVDDDFILNNTGLIWCNADFAFKGFIFQPFELKIDAVNSLAENPFGNVLELRQLVQSHPLFDAYPKLHSVTVSFDLKSSSGSMSDDGKHISCSLNEIREAIASGPDAVNDFLIDILTHEIQHFVQRQEPNWSHGNNVSAINPSSLDKQITAHAYRLSQAMPKPMVEVEFDTFIESLKEKYDLECKYDAWDDDLISPEDYKRLTELDAEVEKSPLPNLRYKAQENLRDIRTYLKMEEKFDAQKWYERTTGEIYANFCMDFHKLAANDHNKLRAFSDQFKSVLNRELVHIHRGNQHIDKDIDSKRESLGFIDFYENSQATISLIEGKSDLMTWLHESLGHYVYENLKNASALPDAPSWVKEAMYLLDTQFFQYMQDNRAKHELFSDAVEEYVSRPRLGQSPEIRALADLVKQELSDLGNYQKDANVLKFDSHQMKYFERAFNKATQEPQYQPQ